VVSSPPATEETGATGREIEGYRVVDFVLRKKNTRKHLKDDFLTAVITCEPECLWLTKKHSAVQNEPALPLEEA
jgi:hypothetical protein